MDGISMDGIGYAQYWLKVQALAHMAWLKVQWIGEWLNIILI